MQLKNAELFSNGLRWEILRSGKPGKILLDISRPFGGNDFPVRITPYSTNHGITYDALWYVRPVAGKGDLCSVFHHPVDQHFTLIDGVEILDIDDALMCTPAMQLVSSYTVTWNEVGVEKSSDSLSLRVAMLIADNLEGWIATRKGLEGTRFYLEKEKATGKYFLYGHQYLSRSPASSPMRLPVTLSGDDPEFQLQDEHVGLYVFGSWANNEITTRIGINMHDLYGNS